MNSDLITELIKGTSYQEEAYKTLVAKFIREKYSVNDEIAIIRQERLKPTEFAEYNEYVEQCKKRAKEQIKK